ncbi:hypothetical protein RvY_04386 [Ramazzottius varieornatus]|uniref:Uncharacterized protein n=1 Tax=Ramazzottius varieornatus TaxID=947166 RepID=A0A1D1URF4_RAMVA|nr:hypothetical protein RvY_04386 [Ramazzottius varieornatus]
MLTATNRIIPLLCSCSVLFTLRLPFLNALPLSNTDGDELNVVIIDGRHVQTSGNQKVRNKDALVWCRPDAIPDLREAGFCSSQDDLDNLCIFLEISESKKDCEAFRGKYCCYRSIPQGNSFEKISAETIFIEEAVNKGRFEHRVNVRPSVETTECRPDAIPNLQEAGFCASVDEIDPLCWLLEISEAVNTCAAFKGNHCCYRSLSQGNTLIELSGSHWNSVRLAAESVVVPQRILLPPVPAPEAVTELVGTTVPQETTVAMLMASTSALSSVPPPPAPDSTINSSTFTTAAAELITESTTALTQETTATPVETTVAPATDETTEEPFSAVAEDVATIMNATNAESADTTTSEPTTVILNSSRPSSHRRRLL